MAVRSLWNFIRLQVALLALMIIVAPLGFVSAQDKPYDGTTVKVVVNAEYVKFAMQLIADELKAKHGISLDVEVIPGDAFPTKTLLEFTSGRSPWDLIMFNPTDFADYSRHLEPLEPYIEKLGLQLHLDDIAEAYKKNQHVLGR
jgi:ABC-type glycerol-3-phosphate transport system substrate-binding protein